jgi:hypothetical protein
VGRKVFTESQKGRSPSETDPWSDWSLDSDAPACCRNRRPDPSPLRLPRAPDRVLSSTRTRNRSRAYSSMCPELVDAVLISTPRSSDQGVRQGAPCAAHRSDDRRLTIGPSPNTSRSKFEALLYLTAQMVYQRGRRISMA